MSDTTHRPRRTRWLLALGGMISVLLGCGGWVCLEYWRKGYSFGTEDHHFSSDIPTGRDQGSGEVEPPPLRELSRRLRSPDEEERASALSALGKLGREGKPLARQVVRLLDDESLRVRQEAASALFEIEGKEAVPVLVKYLETDPDPDFCGRIAGAVSPLPIEDELAISCYILCLRREEESFYDVRMFAFYQLIKRGKRAVPSLLKVIKNKEEKTTLRAVALDTLNRIAPTTEEAVSALVPLVEDPDDDLSRLATDGLGKIGSGSITARRCLEKATANGCTLARRLQAARSLYMVDRSNRLSIPAFIAGLRSDDQTLRRFSATELWEIGSPAREAVSALKDVLGDSELYVRIWAIHALGKIGPAAAPAIPRLLELKNDPSESIREAVNNALSKIQSPSQKKHPDN